jgi:tetratricopeptide (TPR) repeat protein
MDRRRWTLGLAACLLVTGLVGDRAVAAGQDQENEAKLRDARGKAYAHLMRSTLAAQRGDLKKAADEIQAATKLNPDSAAIHAQAAEMLLLLGRTEQAEAAARRSQELEPDHPRTLRFLADRATERLRGADASDVALHEDALKLLLRLKELGHADAEVMHAIRAIRLRLGDLDGALEAARELVEMRPGDKRAVSQLIGLYLEQSREPEALDTVLAYVAKHPNDDELLGFAQELSDKLGAWDRVDEVLSAEPGLATSNTVAQRLWALAYLELDETGQAVGAFDRALVAQPDDIGLRYDAARVYREVGRRADAASLLHELAKDSPSDRRVFLMLGETLADQGLIDGAQNAFVAALRLFSTEGNDAIPIRDAIRRRMILLYLANDQIEPARHLQAELEQPGGPDALELAARIAIRTEDWSAARSAIKRLRENAEPGVAALLETETLLRTGKHTKALTRAREAIDALGPFTRVRIAEIQLELDHLADGEALLQGWVESEPGSSDAHYYLGSYLYRSSGLARAEPELRKAVELDPEHAPALNFLGYSLADEGQREDEALSLVQLALEVDPWNGAYLDSLGWVYFRMGRYEEAREPLEAAAREFPSDAVVLEHLGDLYESIGESDLALSAWGQALDFGPEDPAKIEAKIASLGR